MTYNTPDEVINAFASGEIGRDELEFLLNSPCYGLDRFEYIDCLNSADDLRAAVLNCSWFHETYYDLRGTS